MTAGLLFLGFHGDMEKTDETRPSQFQEVCVIGRKQSQIE